MYQWIVYLHVFAAFGFILGHGASAAVMFRVRHERHPEKLKALMEVSLSLTNFGYISLIVMLVAGIILGFWGRWWGQGWVWLAIGILIVMSLLMAIFAANRFHRLRWALGLPSPPDKEPPPLEMAPAEEIDRIAKLGRPILVTAIGVLGWGLILWLMMFKPF